MQLALRPLLTVLVAVGSQFPVAATAATFLARSNATFLGRSNLWASPPAEDASLEAATVDTIEDIMPTSFQIDAAMQSHTACSCDCCQVQKLLPMDFVKRKSGPSVESACMKPTEKQDSETICPRVCQAGRSKILSSAKGEIDYTRFCLYSCQPVSDAPGSKCAEFDSKHYKEAVTNDGNGKEVYPPRIPHVVRTRLRVQTQRGSKGSGPGEGTGGAGASGGGGGGAGVAPPSPGPAGGPSPGGAGAGGKAEKLQIVYDMRKLIAERLRSEAGASVAAAAAAAERVRINKWMAEKKEVLLKKTRARMDRVIGKVEVAAAGVEANSAAADAAETKTKKNLVEGRSFAANMIEEVRKLTDAAIKEAVEPCAAVAAKARAEAKGLDKPKDWVKVVAARAANPYQIAVTDAVMRTDEYKRSADGLMDQAYGAQKKANSLIPHVNLLEAQGDVLGATIERKRVTDLLASAQSLQSSAKVNWGIAQKTRNTIPKWQNAAAQAAAYAAWEYGANAKAFR